VQDTDRVDRIGYNALGLVPSLLTVNLRERLNLWMPRDQTDNDLMSL